MENEIGKKIILMIAVVGIYFAFSFSIMMAQGPGIEEKPNIVLIYVDDMGFSDISAYGSSHGQHLIETPNIDKLASEGKKFTNAYVAAPLCTPSRVGLLTGKTPARLNFEFVTKNEDENYSWDDPKWIDKWSAHRLLPPPFTLNLPLDEVTIAEALSEAGYETAISGKWHVATHYRHYKGWSPTHGPVQQGFDFAAETFGSHPYAHTVEQKEIELKDYETGKYPVDELTNRAIDFIEEDHDHPFFLFVSHYYVHTPIDTKAKWLIEKYRKKAGPDVSDERILYAAFVETLDFYIGQLLDAMASKNIQDDTIVVLTSDNGGHPEFAFNRPYRGSKWNLYEGGIRVPMIIRWPGIVKAGSESDLPISQIDFMPTFMEIAKVDEGARKLDGISILPILRDGSLDDYEYNARSLYWHFPYYHPEGDAYNQAKRDIGIEDGYISRTTPQSAIRKGKLKLIYFYDEDRTELYDLSKDPSEQTDLSSVRPWDTNALKIELFEKLNDAGARFPRVYSNLEL
jgi:uncharacterized sulfatase